MDQVPNHDPITEPTVTTQVPPPVVHSTNKKLIQVVSLVLILSGLGALGVYAYQSYFQPPQTSIVSGDPTANWLNYQSSAKALSLRYHPSWFIADCNSLYMDTKDLGGSKFCSSDQVIPRIVIKSNIGDKRAEDYGLSGVSIGETAFKVDKTENVTVGGVLGKRVLGTVVADFESRLPPIKGTREIIYSFYTNGRTYALLYTEPPGSQDLSSDFDLMVKSSLKFSN